MNFNVPVYISMDNKVSTITVNCSETENLWTCQCIRYPDAIGVNTNLQLCIKEVVDNVKKQHKAPAEDKNNEHN